MSPLEQSRNVPLQRVPRAPIPSYQGKWGFGLRRVRSRPRTPVLRGAGGKALTGSAASSTMRAKREWERSLRNQGDISTLPRHPCQNPTKTVPSTGRCPGDGGSSRCSPAQKCQIRSKGPLPCARGSVAVVAVELDPGPRTGIDQPETSREAGSLTVVRRQASK